MPKLPVKSIVLQIFLILCASMNSTIKVVTHGDGFNETNALELVKQYDVVVDASDNVSTRYLVNDACGMC